YRQYRTDCLDFARSEIGYIREADMIAAELFQDAVIAMDEAVRMGRLELLTVKPTTYLNAVIRRQWRQKRSRERALDLSRLLVETNYDKEQITILQQRVRDCLAQLPARCREALSLRFLFGWDNEDVALEMDYKSEASVRNLVPRCKKQFRELFPKIKPVEPTNINPHELNK
ncbi:MAG: sigma-70 family RNA polymerase sigma factor, partial [Bacteroidota bacterium]